MFGAKCLAAAIPGCRRAHVLVGGVHGVLSGAAGAGAAAATAALASLVPPGERSTASLQQRLSRVFCAGSLGLQGVAGEGTQKGHGEVQMPRRRDAETQPFL